MLPPHRPTMLPDVIEEVSGLVYHYTSPEGLLGMLRGNALWASEVTSLNDLTEVRYGWDLIAQWIEKQAPSEALDAIRAAVEWFNRRDREVFVLSASLDGDDANQWRLYGADRRGYAVGLDASTLLTVVSRDDVDPDIKPGVGLALRHAVEVSPWLRVLYGDEQTFTAMDELLAATESAVQRLTDTDFGSDPEGPSDAFQDLQSDVQAAASTVAALAKPLGFRGENEARIVATFVFGATHYDYRASRDGVVPFVRLVPCPKDLGYLRVIEPDEQTEVLPIKSVTLGPRLRDENRRTIKRLLLRFGHEGASKVEVMRSKVPLR
jgi:hypothetical protein